MDVIYAVSCKTGVLSTVLLLYILYIKSSWGSYGDARVIWQRGSVAFGPGDPWLRVPGRAALQGNALSNQHFGVLWVNHKTWPGCEKTAMSKCSF